MNAVAAWFAVESHRGWLYRVSLAVGLIVVGYGLMSGEQLALWTGLVGTLLSALPAGNTSTKKPPLDNYKDVGWIDHEGL